MPRPPLSAVLSYYDGRQQPEHQPERGSLGPQAPCDPDELLHGFSLTARVLMIFGAERR